MTVLCVIFLTTTLIAGCAEKAPIMVSGDLSCERFRHISASDEQIAALKPLRAILRSWLEQIAAHNTEYDKDCVGTASDPRGKGK